MNIEQAMIFTQGGFRKGSVTFEEKILEVRTGGESGYEQLPYLIPGLVDIHSHGAMHCDHSDGSAEGLSRMAAYYAANGVTSFLATTMTYEESVLTQAVRTAQAYMHTHMQTHMGTRAARCLGVNMEGPFLSYAKRGAHMAEKLKQPDIALFERLYQASGEAIKLISIAPEVAGAMGFIKEVSNVCHIALAHTQADYETAMRAFENGASHVTHLFNAMNPFLHREPGLIGAAMDAGATVELITDGIHLHPSVIRAAFRMFGKQTCMVSDSIRSAGLPDGSYTSGGLPILVNGGKATLADGTIAGSNISLMEGVRRAVRCGIPLEKAVAAATGANAQAIGMQGVVGCIAKGAYADMVMLDASLQILRVYIGGRAYAV